MIGEQMTKVVILAGGLGTRLGDLTETVPKPMVTVAGVPIIVRIMSHYASFGFRDFVLALGYRADYVKNYFANFKENTEDFSINLKDGNIKFLETNKLDWSVTLVDTGLNTMTGGRVRRLRDILGDDRFLLTYGDGLSDVNISKLIDFHEKHKRTATVTAVRPKARFGRLEISPDGVVTKFEEKPDMEAGRINGGFFVFEPKIFEYLTDDSTILEKEPLERCSADNSLMAYHHDGFWQCMDTKRDRELLEALFAN